MAISPPWPKTTRPSPFSSLLSQPFSHYSTACEKSARSEKIEVEIIFYSSSLQTDTPLPLPSWQLHYCHFGDHWLDQCHPQPESFAFNPWNSIISQVVAFGAIDASCYQMPELVSSTRSPFGQQWANIHVCENFTESWTQRSLQITFIAAITGLVQNGGLILSYNENEKKLHVKLPRSSRRCFSPWRRGRKTLEADTFSWANRGMGGNIFFSSAAPTGWDGRKHTHCTLPDRTTGWQAWWNIGGT